MWRTCKYSSPTQGYMPDQSSRLFMTVWTFFLRQKHQFWERNWLFHPQIFLLSDFKQWHTIFKCFDLSTKKTWPMCSWSSAMFTTEFFSAMAMWHHSLGLYYSLIYHLFYYCNKIWLRLIKPISVVFLSCQRGLLELIINHIPMLIQTPSLRTLFRKYWRLNYYIKM